MEFLLFREFFLFNLRFELATHLFGDVTQRNQRVGKMFGGECLNRDPHAEQ